MYWGLFHPHHYLAYLVLVLLALVTALSLKGWLQGRDYRPMDKRLGLCAMLATHIQFTLGLGLYFVSPFTTTAMHDFGAAMKNSELRLYAVEHPTVMLLAVVMVTIARVKTKRSDSNAAHRTSFIFHAIALLLVLSRIPWAKWLGLVADQPVEPLEC